MKPKELEAIKRRAETATDEPWYGPRITDDWPPGWVGVYAGYTNNNEPIPFAVIGVCGRFDEEAVKENAEFIAHARTDIPELVTEVEKRGSLLKQAMSHLEFHDDTGPPEEGWQSDELVLLLKQIYEALEDE